MTLSQAQRREVRQRANGCCEYCRLSATSATVPFHVDHFIPLKHGGTDAYSNLCFACFHCNICKSHDLTGLDPFTGKITALFNPRQLIWDAHFALTTDMQITGLTPEGRTTARVLQFNLEERIESRQVLGEIGEYPCQQNSPGEQSP
ncbi:MAG: HNH endonuclease [Armatimonadetes bacterium]|nr:HNH endonuclease [Anaerolineae bacterium]